MNCGECLMERTEMVPLVNGRCPKCGADYKVDGPKPPAKLTLLKTERKDKKK